MSHNFDVDEVDRLCCREGRLSVSDIYHVMSTSFGSKLRNVCLVIFKYTGTALNTVKMPIHKIKKENLSPRTKSKIINIKIVNGVFHTTVKCRTP